MRLINLFDCRNSTEAPLLGARHRPKRRRHSAIKSGHGRDGLYQEKHKPSSQMLLSSPCYSSPKDHGRVTTNNQRNLTTTHLIRAPFYLAVAILSISVASR